MDSIQIWPFTMESFLLEKCFQKTVLHYSHLEGFFFFLLPLEVTFRVINLVYSGDSCLSPLTTENKDHIQLFINISSSKATLKGIVLGMYTLNTT